MAKRLFSEADDRQLAMAYASGESSTKLAKKYGCDKSAVLNALRRAGAEIRDSGKARRKDLEARHDEIVGRYKSGASVWAIKRALGCSHGNPIARILRSAGIEIERRPTAGSAHHKWKGGHHLDQSGYRRVRLRRSDRFYPMCAANGYVMEHRLVMARALGRILEPTETVHHVDGRRHNNALSNLELRHGRHGDGVALRCRTCGSRDIEAVELSPEQKKRS